MMVKFTGRTNSGVRLCWELEDPEGPKGRGPTLWLVRGRATGVLRS